MIKKIILILIKFTKNTFRAEFVGFTNDRRHREPQNIYFLRIIIKLTLLLLPATSNLKPQI